MDSSQIRDWILRTAESSVGFHREESVRLTRDEREMVLRLYESGIPRKPSPISQSYNMCWMNSALGLTLFPRSEHMLKYLRQKLDSKEPCVDVVFAYVLVVGFGKYASEADSTMEPVDHAFLACLDQHSREQEDVGRGVHNIAQRFGISLDAFEHTRVSRWRSLAQPDRVVRQTEDRIPLAVLNPQEQFERVLDKYEEDTPMNRFRTAFTEVYSHSDRKFEHAVVGSAPGETKRASFKGGSYTTAPLLCFPMRQEVLLPCFFSSRMYADTDENHNEFLNLPVQKHEPKDRRFMWGDDEILVCSNAHVREVRERALPLMLKNWLRLVEELSLYSEIFGDCAAELAEASRAAFARDLPGYKRAEKLKDGGGVSPQEIARVALKTFNSYTFAGLDAPVVVNVDDCVVPRTVVTSSKFRVLLTVLHEVCAAARVFEFPARVACLQDAADDVFLNGNPLFAKLMGVIRGSGAAAGAFRRIGELAKQHARRMRMLIQKIRYYPKLTKPLYDVAVVMRCIEDGLHDVTQMPQSASRETELTGLYRQNVLRDLSPRTPGSVLFLNLSREGVSRNPIAFKSTEVKIGSLEFEIIGAAIPTSTSGKAAGHWFVVVKDPGSKTYFKIDSLHGVLELTQAKFFITIRKASILLLQIPTPIPIPTPTPTPTSNPSSSLGSESVPDADALGLIRRVKNAISQPRRDYSLVVVAGT